MKNNYEEAFEKLSKRYMELLKECKILKEENEKLKKGKKQEEDTELMKDLKAMFEKF